MKRKIQRMSIILILFIQLIFIENISLATSLNKTNSQMLMEKYSNTNYTNVVRKNRTISFDDINVENVREAGESCGSEINRWIGVTLTIIQVLGVYISIILAAIGFVNMIKNNIDEKNSRENSESKENLYSDNATLKGKENNKKRPTIRYFIIPIILWSASSLLQITKNFAKPIIYVYPDKEKEVEIKVKNPERLTCSYPKYKDGWNVLAQPNGDLIELKTNRKLYALYWEGMNVGKVNLKEGFIVEGENVVEFLEEKLEILGLNEREAEEFIVYWLPLMEKNKYNYIRFENIKEINENMELEITPAPETLIRINMVFKGLRKPFDVEEQKLEKVERKGYTVVEWGGTKL